MFHSFSFSSFSFSSFSSSFDEVLLSLINNHFTKNAFHCSLCYVKFLVCLVMNSLTYFWAIYFLMKNFSFIFTLVLRSWFDFFDDGRFLISSFDTHNIWLCYFYFNFDACWLRKCLQQNCHLFFLFVLVFVVQGSMTQVQGLLKMGQQNNKKN